jgi:hypothetical protein
LRDVENDAVGILEFALEVVVVLLAEVEEEGADGGFDRILRALEVVDLEAEMMGADVISASLSPEPRSPVYLMSARLVSPSLK